jgi:ribonuclease P protein component
MARQKGPSKQRFEKIFTEGMRASGPNLRVLRLPGTGFVGVATPKKIGARPRRNHQRRRLQVGFAQEIGPQPQWDVVLIAGSTLPLLALSDLRSELRQRWSELEERCVVPSE